MKTVFFFFLVALNAVSLSASFRNSDYSISSFHLVSSDLEHKKFDIIKSENDSILQSCDIVPVLKPGQIIMRQKIKNRYDLYKGVLDTGSLKDGFLPVYVFPMPDWAQLEDIIKFRFYRLPSDKPGNDEEVVFFDNDRIYIRNFSKIYYLRNGRWSLLTGSDTLPTGSLNITSDPPGAQVFVNGKNMHRVTPCTLDGLLSGIYTIELHLSNYHFNQKSIRVVKDSIVSATFQLISDMDTVYITGDVQYGLLMLPEPPLAAPYLIDYEKAVSTKMRLCPGEHRLRWDGGLYYESIDTVVNVLQNKVQYFDYQFKPRYGMLHVIVHPPDAKVCLENSKCQTGEQTIKLKTGEYIVSAQRWGYRDLKKSIKVFPDSITDCEMNLTQLSDRDGDGFLDSIDKCPDIYGLYDGCPKRSSTNAIRVKLEEIGEYVKEDPFTIGISVMGLITRISTNKKFNNFLTAFSSGKVGGINNYRGLTFMNMVELSFRGMFASVELGQWAAGIHFERPDTMLLKGKDSDYLIYYDSLSGIKPVLYIPGTVVTAGLHYNWSRVNVIYSIGYQWEDIVINDLHNITTDTFSKVTFDNDWWFHQLILEADIRAEKYLKPSFYFRVKIPVGRTKRTRWHVMHTGFQLKILPKYFKERKK